MRFLCIYKPAKAEGARPTPEMMETMGKFIEQSFQEGLLLSTEGCLPSALGARVRSTGGSHTVTDGPSPSPKRSWADWPSSRSNPKKRPSNSPSAS
jgi:hypothetical protein